MQSEKKTEGEFTRRASDSEREGGWVLSGMGVGHGGRKDTLGVTYPFACYFFLVGTMPEKLPYQVPDHQLH